MVDARRPPLPRQTHAIGQKAAQSLYHSFQQAERIGLPLNQHVTINFASTAIDGTLAVAAFSQLRRSRFNKWIARQGVAPAGAFAFENVRDGLPFETIEPGGTHNVHVHWAVHIPANLQHDFEAQLIGWIEKLTGGLTDPATVLKVTHPDQRHLRRYLLKGCTDQWAAIYGAVAQPQGIIVGGRRSGTTANLSRSERIAFDRAAGLRRTIPARPSPRFLNPVA